jgi:hypothetical protein
MLAALALLATTLDIPARVDSAATGSETVAGAYIRYEPAAPCACGTATVALANLDGTPRKTRLAVSNPVELAAAPSIAADPAHAAYLVVWTAMGQPPLPIGGGATPEVHGAIVLERGAVLPEIRIAAAAGNDTRAKVVWDSDRYRVFFDDRVVDVSANGDAGEPQVIRAGWRIEDAAVNLNHATVEVLSSGATTEVFLDRFHAFDLGHADTPRVASDGLQFVVVWLQDDKLVASALDGQPHVLADVPAFFGALQIIPADHGYFVAYANRGWWVDPRQWTATPVPLGADVAWAALTQLPDEHPAAFLLHVLRSGIPELPPQTYTEFRELLPPRGRAFIRR